MNGLDFNYLRLMSLDTTTRLGESIEPCILNFYCNDPNVDVDEWPSGSGCVKLVANYSPTLRANEGSNKEGYDIDLELFDPVKRAVTEDGAANFSMIWV
ncbi:hypothetical protein V1511DRAFT_513412 [Dipodascopsis uninucleata]